MGSLMSYFTKDDPPRPRYSYDTDPWRAAETERDVRIRLIELAPSGKTSFGHPMDGSQLSCRIFWTPLASPTPYKALSYTWGRGGFTQDIDVSGAGLKITETLEEALKHIRHPTESITLWIDQICINQTDDFEKSEQVAHMNHVYRNAEKVLVWLGPAADDSDRFMNAASTIGQMAHDFGMRDYLKKNGTTTVTKVLHKQTPKDPKDIEFYKMLERTVTLIDEETLVAIVKWQKRPWFRRVWVVQEFTLSNSATFICGSKRANVDYVQYARQMITIGAPFIAQKWPIDAANRALSLLRAVDTIGPFFTLRDRRKACDEICTLWDTRKAFDERKIRSICGYGIYDLLQTLFVSTKLNATEACDTVFGILALAHDAEKLGIRPDYTLKDRVDLIYIRLTRAIIQAGKVDILAFAQQPKAEKNIPSWVPDWTAKIQQSFAWSSPQEDRLFNASKGLPVELTSTEDESLLGLRGFKVDTIEEVAGIWIGNESLENTGPDNTRPVDHQRSITYLAQIRLLLRLSAHKGNDIYTTPERRAEALWRIPLGDIESDETFTPIRATLNCVEAYEMCIRMLEFHEQGKALTSTEFWPQYVKRKEERATYIGGRYLSRMDEIKNKRPFLTQEGFVGLGPLYMLPGDMVVVFKGARIPYVIRPLEAKGEEKQYRFLGECYCDGIMDGEIVESRDSEVFLLSGEGMVTQD